MNSIRPFIVHFISKFVTEESERIDCIGIFVKWLILREGRDTFEGTVIMMSLKNPKVGIQQFPSNPDRRVCFFEPSAINKSYKIEVVFFIGMPTIMPDGWQEEESDEEEPYTPPVKTYREDCCVAKYFVFRLLAYNYLRLLRSFKENRSKKLRRVSSRNF